jgi:hypothetical protein
MVRGFPLLCCVPNRVPSGGEKTLHLGLDIAFELIPGRTIYWWRARGDRRTIGLDDRT